jgi:hypothetical protein
MGRADVLIAVAGVDIASAFVFDAAIRVLNISASSAIARRSMLPTSLDRVS